MQHHARWRSIWFCPIPGCPASTSNKEGLVRHLQSKQHTKGFDTLRGRTLAKQIVHQNCFWPVNQTLADKLLRASKRLIRYVALYSMAGVAIETRVFRIVPSARDTPFIDACAAFLTPKMNHSQVMPSGCNLRRVTVPPRNQLAIPERPSVSAFGEEQSVVDPATMQTGLATPVFQLYRGATGRTWMAQEYGITADTSSSLISSASGTEREDADEEVCSFDLGPEPFDPECQGRLPSDEWLDDHQQGLIPGSSEPNNFDFNKYLAMPNRPSILDMMRQEVDTSDDVSPTSPERALTPTIGFEYDYTTDAPPDIKRIVDTPVYSTPFPDLPTLSARPGPVLPIPRPRSTSVPPISKTIKRMAKRYMPVTETVTSTNIACARTRHGSADGHRHPYSDSEARKKPGSWQVARPSERKPWCGHQEQVQTGRTRPSRSHAGTGARVTDQRQN